MSAGSPFPSAFLSPSSSPCPAGSSGNPESAPRRMRCWLAASLRCSVVPSRSSSARSAGGTCSGPGPGPSRKGSCPAGTAGSAACPSANVLVPA
eukprot:16339692-Heterocapsa_arctica.AAC.1